jgi:hypothetical protein
MVNITEKFKVSGLKFEVFVYTALPNLKLQTSNFKLNWNYRYERFVVSLFAELNCAVNQSIERMIASNADIFTRMVHGATLTHQNITGFAYLPAKQFDA